VIFNTDHARLFGAIGAAEKCFLRFDAVTDNFAAAMRADGRKFVNGTLEAIENVPVARRNNFKRQIIIVAANFALRHNFSTPLISFRSVPAPLPNENSNSQTRQNRQWTFNHLCLVR